MGIKRSGRYLVDDQGMAIGIWIEPKHISEIEADENARQQAFEAFIKKRDFEKSLSSELSRFKSKAVSWDGVNDEWNRWSKCKAVSLRYRVKSVIGRRKRQGGRYYLRQGGEPNTWSKFSMLAPKRLRCEANWRLRDPWINWSENTSSNMRKREDRRAEEIKIEGGNIVRDNVPVRKAKLQMQLNWD